MLDSYLIRKLISNNRNEHFEGESSSQGGVMTVWTIIGFGTAIWATILAWNCNKKVDLLIRILICIIAFSFSLFYLIFYLIYHKIFLNQCQ